MNRIPRNVKPKVFNLTKNHKIIKKHNPVMEKLIKPSKLEKTPLQDTFFYEVFDDACLDKEKAERLFKYGMNFLHN